jgi:hypothetical protein
MTWFSKVRTISTVQIRCSLGKAVQESDGDVLNRVAGPVVLGDVQARDSETAAEVAREKLGANLHKVARKHRDPLDTSLPCLRPTSKIVSLFQVVRRWYHVSVLRVLLAECCSLVHRIQVLLQIREWEIQDGVDSARTGMSPILVSGSRTYKRAYRRYMQQLQMEHPWLSTVDHRLVTQAWKAGSVWDGLEGISRTQVDDSYERGNSMPPQAVQQSTKHDSSTPLPSRV